MLCFLCFSQIGFVQSQFSLLKIPSYHQQAGEIRPEPGGEADMAMTEVRLQIQTAGGGDLWTLAVVVAHWLSFLGWFYEDFSFYFLGFYGDWLGFNFKIGDVNEIYPELKSVRLTMPI